MHFVTGGAFQGKRKWVQQVISSQQKEVVPFWSIGYKEAFPDLKSIPSDHHVIVIEGLEMFIRKSLTEEKDRLVWKERLHPYLLWEKADSSRSLFIIGSEVGLGVVPMNKEDRLYRDVVGWIYQDVAEQADVVVRIWCGIPQKLKGEA